MSKKIKVGIAGMGRAGRFMHVPELSQFPEWFELVACADFVPSRLTGLPEQLKDAATYATVDELIADPEVEMVSIATRSEYHVSQAIAALEAGKYAVVDKPVAVSYEEALKLKAAGEKHPGRLFLRFNRRFEPLFNQIREIIAEGILGDIRMIKLYRHTGFVRRYDWQTLREFHGGLLNNWGPHLIDQALCFLESPVRDLWCDMQHNVAAGDAEDQIKLLLRSESGRVADIEISGATTLSGNWYELWGTRGTLSAPDNNSPIKLRYLDPEQQLPPLQAIRGEFPLTYGNRNDDLRFIDEERELKLSTDPTFQRGRMVNPASAKESSGYTYQATMWRHIYAAITENKPYPVTLDDGVEVSRIISEARKASGFQPHTIWD